MAPAIYDLALKFALSLILLTIVCIPLFFLKRKYLPIIELHFVNFLKKVLRSDKEIDLLVDKEVIANLDYNEYTRELCSSY